MLETDGPYGGGACASTHHAHHRGVEDSVYMQSRKQAELYTEMRRLNVYVNQPDDYFVRCWALFAPCSLLLLLLL